MKKFKDIGRRAFVYALLTFIVMGAIFFFSSQPADDSSKLSGWLLNSALGQFILRLLPPLSSLGREHDLRKYAHMFEYACLGISSFLAIFEILYGNTVKLLRTFGTAWIFCCFYAFTDEIHQLFVDGRSCQLSDVGIDSIGFTIGISVAAAAVGLMHMKEKRVTVNG